MRKLFSLILAFFIAAGPPASADPTEGEIRVFHDAIPTADTSEIESMLQANPALAMARDPFGFQAIHLLDYIGFREKLALLVAYGADINARNDEGHAPLHILIDAEFLPDLLAAGADLELKDKQGRTPLLLALTEPGTEDMIAALLAAGADPGARDNNGLSALDHATAFGDPAIVELLTRAGAGG